MFAPVFVKLGETKLMSGKSKTSSALGSPKDKVDVADAPLKHTNCKMTNWSGSWM